MVLVQLLCIVLSARQSWQEILRDTNESLDDEEDVGYKTKDGVRRLEVNAVVSDLVVFDDDQTGDGGEECNFIQTCVPPCTVLFLVFGMRRLKDEHSLGEEEDCGLY